MKDGFNSVPSAVCTCAVVQGNVRRGTDEVLKFLAQHVDSVILSTWDDESPDSIPQGNWEVLRNTKPAVPGISHRNYQRRSTAAGLLRAQELGATHVLKWRTDMLPTRLDMRQLLVWAHTDVPPGMSSRLVTCAFRNLTVAQDWFSTMPDLFAFGHIDTMQMLWGDAGFAYDQPMNRPPEMDREVDADWLTREDAGGVYCPEAELYALFKARLQRAIGKSLGHMEIARAYMRLVDHRRLGICWFGEGGTFRSILQALQHPWWTEATWINGDPFVSEIGYPEKGLKQKLRGKYLTPFVIRQELKLQRKWYAESR